MSPDIQNLLMEMAPAAASVAAMVMVANLAIWQLKKMREAADDKVAEIKAFAFKSESLTKSPMQGVASSEFAQQYAVNLVGGFDKKTGQFVNFQGMNRSAMPIDDTQRRDALGMAIEDYKADIAENDGEIPDDIDSEYFQDYNTYQALTQYGISYESAHTDPEAFVEYQQEQERIQTLRKKYGWQ